MKRTRLHMVLAAVVATAILSLGAGGGLVMPALASVPGTPGVAQAGTPVYAEDFSHHDASGAAVSILDYSGGAAAANQTYTADAPYTPAGGQCDGWILNSFTPLPTDDTGCQRNQPGGWNQVRSLAVALGVEQGQTPEQAADNQVLSEYTNSANGQIASGVQFRTQSTTIPAIAGHYYAVSAYFAQVNCHAVHANETFSLLINGTRQVLSTGLDPCGSNTTQGGIIEVTKLQSDAYQIPAGTSPSLGLELRNEATSGAGNDVAFDLPQIVDVTPQLDISLSPSLIAPGGSSRATLTVTNTDDLGAKSDWFITDQLPAGVVIAAAPHLGGTCAQASGTDPMVTTAEAGGNTIAVTGGDLAPGMTTCTITVDVTAAGEGAYVNGSSSVLTNLNAPANVSLAVRAPRIKLSAALAGERLHATDQFTAAIRTGSANGPVVSEAAAATTTGAGAIVTAGTGSTGEYIAAEGMPYYLTESAGSPSSYEQIITCVDANGLQPGLPQDAAFAGSLAVVPVAGAYISCVLTNAALPTPGLGFSHSALIPAPDGVSRVGDLITFTFRATNTGNVQLTDVAIASTMSGLSALDYSWPGAPGTLQPSQTVTAKATYALTQADIDAGHVASSATTTGMSPEGVLLTPLPSILTTGLVPAPGVEFSTVADASAVQAPAKVGDRITYTFEARNTGNVTLVDVSVSDPLAGASPLTFAWPEVSGMLQPGQTLTATLAYSVTQADIDAGHVTSSALVTGRPPKGASIAPPVGHLDTPLAPLASNPVVEFSGTADASAVGDPAQVGDLLTYIFSAKNVGDVPLGEVAVDNPMLGLTALVYAWPGEAGTLLPGQMVTATATYAITQADIDAGGVTNAATATGKPPAGGPVTTPPASVVVTFPPVTTATADDDHGTLPPVQTSSASAAGTVPPVVPDQSDSSLPATGVVLTVLPVSVLVVGTGLFLFLAGRRRRSGA